MILKPIDVDEFFNRKVIISDLVSSLNSDDAIYASIVTVDRTEESVVAEVENKTLLYTPQKKRQK